MTTRMEERRDLFPGALEMMVLLGYPADDPRLGQRAEDVVDRLGRDLAEDLACSAGDGVGIGMGVALEQAQDRDAWPGDPQLRVSQHRRRVVRRHGITQPSILE